MSEAHEAAYQASILRPESFWAAAAEGIEWTRRWDSVLDRGAAPAPRWFAGASLSTCHNAVDRHVLTGRGGATAVIRALVVERLPKMRSGITLGSAVRRIADGVDFAVPATIEDASVIEDLRAAPADDQSGAVSYGGTAKPHRATTTHNPPTKESEHGI